MKSKFEQQCINLYIVKSIYDIKSYNNEDIRNGNHDESEI